MDRDKSSKVLRYALALIENPADWCKGTYAQNREGEHIGVAASEACRFCASGALLRSHRAFRGFAYPSLYLERALAETHSHYRGIVNFNDDSTTTHDMVLAMFKRAIELAEADGD